MNIAWFVALDHRWWLLMIVAYHIVPLYPSSHFATIPLSHELFPINRDIP